jgi:hypothetical protein
MGSSRTDVMWSLWSSHHCGIVGMLSLSVALWLISSDEIASVKVGDKLVEDHDEKTWSSGLVLLGLIVMGHQKVHGR